MAIEGRATGIPKILKMMAANGPPSPIFETDDEHTSFVIRLPVREQARATSAVTTTEVTMQVTMEVAPMLTAVDGEMPQQARQAALALKNVDHFRKAHLAPAIAAGCLEMTLPDHPTSRLQSPSKVGGWLQLWQGDDQATAP